jgi:hypothetical protein
LAVVEDFFGGELGKDVALDAPQELSESRFAALQSELLEAAFAYIPARERAESWRAAANVKATARVPISEYWDEWRAALPMCLYTDHVVCEDPVRFPGSAAGVAEGLTKLVELRELLRDGRVSLYPAQLGWNVLSPTPAERRRHNVIAANVPYIPWLLPRDGPVDRDGRAFVKAASRNLPLLGYHNQITKYNAVELLNAARLQLSPVAVASRAGLLDRLLVDASSNVRRANKIAPIVLPSFAGLTGRQIADLRRNSAATNAVRGAIEKVADELPQGNRPPEEVAELVAAVVRPVIDELKREIRTRPSLAACVGFGLSLGTAVVSVALGHPDAATIAGTAGPAATLAIEGLGARQKRAAGRMAARTLLDFSVAGIDPNVYTEDNRQDFLASLLPYFGDAPEPPRRDRWGAFVFPGDAGA